MLAGGIIASKWVVKMEGTMNEQSIALKLDDVEFRRRRRVILTKVNLEVKKARNGCCSVPTASANPRWCR